MRRITDRREPDHDFAFGLGTVTRNGFIAIEEHIYGDVGVDGLIGELCDIGGRGGTIAHPVRPLQVEHEVLDITHQDRQRLASNLCVGERMHRLRLGSDGILPGDGKFGRGVLGGIGLVVERSNLRS